LRIFETSEARRRHWTFAPDLKFVACGDQGLHGPTPLSRGEIANGKIVETHHWLAEKLPGAAELERGL
jgi:hypothetical protein